MEVNITGQYTDIADLKKILQKVSEIEKECNCTCTLNLFEDLSNEFPMFEAFAKEVSSVNQKDLRASQPRYL